MVRNPDGAWLMQKSRNTFKKKVTHKWVKFMERSSPNVVEKLYIDFLYMKSVMCSAVGGSCCRSLVYLQELTLRNHVHFKYLFH